MGSKTIQEATIYASANPVAYPGQFIAVLENDGTAIGYIIQQNGTLKAIGADIADVVKYTEQKLTDEQKTQARENIGASEIIPLTQQEYEKMRSDGNIATTTYYYIYEESES